MIKLEKCNHCGNDSQYINLVVYINILVRKR